MSKVLAALTSLTVIGGIVAHQLHEKGEKKAQADPQQQALQQQAETAQKAKCERESEALWKKYAELTKAGHHGLAARVFAECFILADERMAAAARDSEARHQLSIIKDPKAAPQSRVDALDVFVRDNPASAAVVEPMRSKLTADATRARQVAERAAAAEKRKMGVAIGMTEAEVLASSWGKPRKVNRTIRADLVREQWVYDGGYLYFYNGILRTIQN